VGRQVIYLDANVIIRLIEGDPAAVAAIRSTLGNEQAFVTSELTLLECRCHPLRSGDLSTLDLYDRFFVQDDLTLLPIDRVVIDRATEIRAQHNLKSPDAIHAATCLIHGATALATGDVIFHRVSGLTVKLC
jgi:predicted nucleic acid-binding protein